MSEEQYSDTNLQEPLPDFVRLRDQRLSLCLITIRERFAIPRGQ
jgi:hypothetical protein